MPPSKGSTGDSTVTYASAEAEEDVAADDHNHDGIEHEADNVAGEAGTGLFRRRPYVSRHRLELDRIATDSAGTRRYAPGIGSSQNGDSSLEHPHNQNKEPSCTSGCLKLAAQGRAALEERTCDDWTETFLPCWRWLKKYEWRSTLPKDLIAGCTVGVMVVPQSMSYARLAGLPVQYGLYSALVPVYAYAVFGSSRQLAIGPVALLSLLLSTGLPKILEGSGHFPEDADYQERYNQVAIQTSFLVGITYIFMGLARLG
jgi:sulfate transporter 4